MSESDSKNMWAECESVAEDLAKSIFTRQTHVSCPDPCDNVCTDVLLSLPAK